MTREHNRFLTHAIPDSTRVLAIRSDGQFNSHVLPTDAMSNGDEGPIKHGPTRRLAYAKKNAKQFAVWRHDRGYNVSVRCPSDVGRCGKS